MRNARGGASSAMLQAAQQRRSPDKALPSQTMLRAGSLRICQHGFVKMVGARLDMNIMNSAFLARSCTSYVQSWP